MRRSKACDDMVRRFEGYHRALPNGDCEAYADPAWGWQVPTIGFGTTRYASAGLKKFARAQVLQGDFLTLAEAETELDVELDSIESALDETLIVPVTQGMWDALVSFCFNVGLGGAEKQLARVNARQYEECARMFDAYVNANGRPLPGLVNRRNAEEELFRKDGLTPNGRPYVPCPVPLPWKEEIAVVDSASTSIYFLQCALVEIGYLRKPADGETIGDVFNEHVAWAVSRFQKERMVESADGIVGPKTRAAIEAALRRVRDEATNQPPDTSVATLRCIEGQWHDGAWAGLKVLNLAIGGETFRVASGARGVQTLRRPEDPRSFPGNLEPIPQGRYRFDGEPEFVNGTDNYEGSWGAGIGPVWHGLTATFSDDRGSFGGHLDQNIVTTPGSAGCYVFRNLSDLKLYVAAWRKHRPQFLDVEWGL